uniref:Uncharacterized protein n=1 Tax=Rhizophora mucronata TaxID=61149 RepID=A0A2P2NJM2_RHIMU
MPKDLCKRFNQRDYLATHGTSLVSNYTKLLNTKRNIFIEQVKIQQLQQVLIPNLIDFWTS